MRTFKVGDVRLGEEPPAPPAVAAQDSNTSGLHNQAAGRDLGAFYARYRVFTRGTREGGVQNNPSDAFYVRIRPGTP
ncbi:hypothetical protein [Streptosporangium sp. LJ11]|uniref:hypothetical protein n=1 Tax=Streptosporangium sp. LJ11 TaxID=3436927 RepID=UPI003F79AC1D